MMLFKHYFILFCCLFIYFKSISQSADEKVSCDLLRDFSVKGYMQFRYNALYNSNSSVGWSEGDGFVLKLLAISISGKIHDRIFVFIQPDFANSASNSKHVVRLSDAYSDLYIDKNAVFRLRIGQSRVPFGYEHLQSSRHRLSLEASEAFANTWSNGRDIGVQFLCTPIKQKQLFKTIASMKGTGDYGMLALGIVNGRKANVGENNKNKYIVGRICYPFFLKTQLFETSVQAYIGKNRLDDNSLSTGVKTNIKKEYDDHRIATTVSLYPKPIGFRAEYVIGRGASFLVDNDSIEVAKLSGGYFLINARIHLQKQLLFPFIQYNYYSGGRPQARDAQNYNLSEWETGIEWHINKHFEVTIIYGDRRSNSADFITKKKFYNKKSLRIQTQISL